MESEFAACAGELCKMGDMFDQLADEALREAARHCTRRKGVASYAEVDDEMVDLALLFMLPAYSASASS